VNPPVIFFLFVFFFSSPHAQVKITDGSQISFNMESWKVMEDIRNEAIARCRKMKKKRLAGRLQTCALFSKYGKLLQASLSIEEVAQGSTNIEVVFTAHSGAGGVEDTRTSVEKRGVPVTSAKSRKRSLLSEVRERVDGAEIRTDQRREEEKKEVREETKEEGPKKEGRKHQG
jgi:hypothetical protein